MKKSAQGILGVVLILWTVAPGATAQSCPVNETVTAITCSSQVAEQMFLSDPNHIGQVLSGDCGSEENENCYSCGDPVSGLGQSGPEHVYSFQCQVSGTVTVRLENPTCNFDLYVLETSCNPVTGCLSGDTNASVTDGSVDFACTAGTTYHLVVEGTGYEVGADPVCTDGDSYELSFEADAGLGCTEDCDDGLDNDLNNDVDCDDAACLSDPACLGILLGSRVLLEGPYSGSGMMSVPSQFSASLPLAQPFSDDSYDGSPLDYDGDEELSAVTDSTIDWVLVSLRSDIAESSTVAGATMAALVNAGGTLTTTDGDELLFPSLPRSQYFLVIRHRNHLAAMSATKIDFSGGYGTWDFRTDGAFSSGGSALKSLGGGLFGLFAGDANFDGQITAPDFNMWNASTTAGETGYRPADHNLDGQVTAPDFNLWNANTTAGASSQVPD
ncbi:MAG TPA: PPC domain-containing protein [Rhodothermales bacterium]